MKNAFEKEPTNRPIDKEAALELVQTSPVLRDDTYTMQVIRDGGYTIEGKFTPITHYDDFLAERERVLKAGSQSKGGPGIKPEHMVTHSDPNEKVE